MLEAIGGLGARIIKAYCDYSSKNSLNSQLVLLNDILKANKSTLFGKTHNFDEIHSIKQFQDQCQPHSYDFFKPFLDKYLSGTNDALFKAPLLFFAQTTGTTSKAKIIPVTYHTIKSYNLGVFRTACCYIAGNPLINAQIIGGKWLYLTGPPLLRYISGFPVGYITGQLMMPLKHEYWRYLISKKYYAPLNFVQIKNIEEQFRIIAKDVISKKITIVVGTTSVVVNLLEFIQKFNNGIRLNRLLPHLHFAILSGSPPKYYESRLKQLFDGDFSYREMYAATEGIMGIQLSENKVLTPLCDSVFFEFIPVKNNNERLLINQIKTGEEYSVIITSHNGLYAYDIGDVIKVTSEDPPTFIFSHRKNTLDITGEKLTTSQIYDAIMSANENNNCRLVDFCVIATYKPKPRYIFIVEIVENQGPKSLEKYLASIDNFLNAINVGYNYNRFSRSTLSPPELWVLKSNTFSSLQKDEIIETPTAGQLKTTRFSHDPKILDIYEPFTTEKIIGN